MELVFEVFILSAKVDKLFLSNFAIFHTRMYESCEQEQKIIDLASSNFSGDTIDISFISFSCPIKLVQNSTGFIFSKSLLFIINC